MNFTAQPKSTIGVAASTSASSPKQFAVSPLTDIAVYNPDASVTIFVEFGGPAVSAVVPTASVVGSMPIPPGAMITMTGGPFVSVITSSGNATLLLTPGNGT